MTTEEQAQFDTLKEQLARMATDNEVLTEQNNKLHDEAQTARKQVQEMGDFNALLTTKAQRLEQENVELGRQRDRYKESFETQQRKHEEAIERLKRQKHLDKTEPTVLNG